MILAHAFGTRGQLPLPIWGVTWGASIVLVGSFVGFGALWPRPRLDRLAAGRLVVGPASTGLRVAHAAGRALALALYLVCLLCGLLGGNETSDNLLPVTLYVVVWVGTAVVSGAVGDLWGAVNPVVTLARGAEAVAARAGWTPRRPPPWLGHWPTAAGLGLFLFYELVHPSGARPRALGILLAVHLGISLVAAVAWGSQWVADHEPFSALFAWIGAVGPVFRHHDGGIGLRAPASGLARLPLTVSAVAALLVVLGGTTYDGFSGSALGYRLLPHRTDWAAVPARLAWMVASIALIGLLYGIAIWWTSRVAAPMGWREAAEAFGPSLVPIVLGYAVGHYTQFLLDESQSFVFRLSDPAGRGWDLFGGSDGLINRGLVDVDVVAWVQVAGIVAGHLGAIMVAHDRSVELFDAETSMRSQFVMLLVLVAYSSLGLWFLLDL